MAAAWKAAWTTFLAMLYMPSSYANVLQHNKSEAPAAAALAATIDLSTIGSTEYCAVSSDNVLAIRVPTSSGTNTGCSLASQVTWDFTGQLIMEFTIRGCYDEACQQAHVRDNTVWPHFFFEPFRNSYTHNGRLSTGELWWISREYDYGFGVHLWDGTGTTPGWDTTVPSDPTQWHTWRIVFTTDNSCVNVVSWSVDGEYTNLGSDAEIPLQRCDRYGTTTWIGWASWYTYTYVKDFSIVGAGYASDPTAAPTPAPTPAATPAPTPALTTPAVGAHGDPHLVNKHGQKFDLFQPGHHTLIQIPRWARRNTHFLVQAKATRAGAGCGDLYFTEINISGSWARKYKAANLRWVAEAPKPRSSAKWITFHSAISVKIVHGHTIENTKYLNILVKGLSKTTVPVGGLLGEDDHTAAATPSNGCRKVLTL